MLQEPAFVEAEFDQLKRSNLAQLDQMRSDPQALAMMGLQKHLAPFGPDDPRAVRTPDEQIADLQKVTLADVKNFYTDFYGASRSELTVIGDFDSEQMQVMARDLFSQWKSPKPFSRLLQPMAAVESINRSMETPDKANATFAAGQLLNVGDEHPDYPALVMGNYLLGGGFLNSRIAARIRQKDGLSYGAGSMFNARAKDETGIFMAYAIAAPQNVAKVEAAFKEELARAIKDGFTEQEIAEGKKGWLQGRDVSRANDSELLMLLAGNAFSIAASTTTPIWRKSRGANGRSDCNRDAAAPCT
ncbi:MAG: insulinase family protein [Bryobacteraceae bacterium]